MAKQRINFDKVTSSIFEVLKDHKDAGNERGMTSNAITTEVVARTGYNGTGWINDCLRVMVSSGRLGGHMTGRQIPTNISYREMPDPGTESTALRVMREALAEAKAATEAAEKKAAETKALERIIEVHIKKEKKAVKKIKAIFHKDFEEVLTLAKARKNIFLYGPTGCGKSHICKQVADALELPFAFVSCTAGMSEGHLAGRLLPTGKSGTFEYIISEFLKMYENGGLFLVDEMDAADPNVLLIINAALANGHMAVPNRPDNPYATRHPDFICIAAANTVGTGGDRMYSGRNKLDGATLDRFAIGKIAMGYDEEVEKKVCPNDALRSRLLKYREAIDAHRLERAMSTRFMIDAHDMTENFGWDFDRVDDAFFRGWREDEVEKIRDFCNNS